MLAGGFAIGQLCFPILESIGAQAHEAQDNGGCSENSPLHYGHVFDTVCNTTKDFGTEF